MPAVEHEDEPLLREGLEHEDEGEGEPESDEPLRLQDMTPHLDRELERAFSEPDRTGWEEPDDTMGLLEEEEAGRPTLTVYKADLEDKQLAGAPPDSPGAVVQQGMLCLTLVCITVYESVFKAKAVRQSKFDFTSLLIMQSAVSIVVGVSLAVVNHEGKALTEKLHINLLKFAPPGILFGAAQYVSFIALVYLSADVFKVLEQTRLLVMAIFCYFIMKKQLSRASWVALIAVTLTCLTYGHMKTAQVAQRNLNEALRENVVRSEKLHMHFEVPDVEDLATPVLQQATSVAESLREAHAAEASALMDSLKQLASGISLSESKSPMTGFALTAVFVVMSCFAGVYSEIVLKKDKHLPFYVQKVFLEISGGLFAIFASFVIRPLLIQNGIAEKKLAISFAEYGMFYGWDHWFVVCLFALTVAKSWLSGIICKQLSAVAKQLCSIVAVSVLYFVILMHDCKDGAFMCPSGIGNVSLHMIIIDMAVLCSVVSYTTALRDKQRKRMYKAQIVEE